LAEGIDVMGYRLDDIQVSIHSGEGLRVLLKGRKFDGYRKAFSIFLNKGLHPGIGVAFKVEDGI